MAVSEFAQPGEDRVSNTLKWVLLGIAVVTFAILGWATSVTYRTAPPQPERFLAPDASVLMSADDISDGKASFQQAALMDYGSIYGMGSYFGEDYTAEYLNRLGVVTADNIARGRFGQPFTALNAEQQTAARTAMQDALKGVDLTRREITLPPPLAATVASLKAAIAERLLHLLRHGQCQKARLLGRSGR